MGFEAQLVQVVGTAVYGFLQRYLSGKKVKIFRKEEGLVFVIKISRQVGVMVRALDNAVKAEFRPIVLAAAEVSLIDEEIERIVRIFNQETQFVCDCSKEESEYRLIYDFSRLSKK